MEPWERDYQTRNWKTYEVEVHSLDEPELQEPRQHFTVCGGESEMAKHLGYAAHRFYYDHEQIAAGLDRVYGGDGPNELAKEWRGHPAGTLIFRAYAGMGKNPPTWTYMVEV